MQNTPILYPYFLSALLSLLLGGYALRFRRHTPAIPFAAMNFFAFIWSLGYIFELGRTDLPGKLLGVQIGYIGIIGLPLSWTAFALIYSGNTQWLTFKNSLRVLIFPILTYAVILSNTNHYWFFSSVGLRTDTTAGLVLIDNPLGWWFWLHATYSYSILIIGSYFLLHKYWEKRAVYRSQIIITMIAVLLPWVSNGIVLMNILPVRIDITSIMFSISILILGWGVLRYQFLDILPIAHHTVFESISDAVIVLDGELRIVELNPAAQELFSIRSNEALGSHFQDLINPWTQLSEKSLRTHGYDKEVVIEENNRPVRWLHLFVSTIRGGNTSGGHIVTMRDVTNIKENESALAIARDEAMQANSFKSQLLANVSHELRTPLGIILGYTDLIARKSYGDLNEKQVSVLGRIKDSTLYLDRLVSELLDQAQLDSGRLKLDLRPFEPREVFSSTCNQLSILADSKNLSFHYHIHEDMPISIIGDSQRLKQILVNLVSNGIKFTETGGITVNIQPVNTEQWQIQVADTGPGIPPEAVRTIFEPFKQLANANRTLRKGYGLGLSITRQLIDLMGGKIEIESILGQGTTFIITLPISSSLSETSVE